MKRKLFSYVGPIKGLQEALETAVTAQNKVLNMYVGPRIGGRK